MIEVVLLILTAFLLLCCAVSLWVVMSILDYLGENWR